MAAVAIRLIDYGVTAYFLVAKPSSNQVCPELTVAYLENLGVFRMTWPVVSQVMWEVGRCIVILMIGMVVVVVVVMEEERRGLARHARRLKLDGKMTCIGVIRKVAFFLKEKSV